MKYYGVVIGEEKRSMIEKYFHDQGIAFRKKAADVGAAYIVEMTEAQSVALKAKFDLATVVELPGVTELEDGSFPDVEPDMPEGSEIDGEYTECEVEGECDGSCDDCNVDPVEKPVKEEKKILGMKPAVAAFVLAVIVIVFVGLL